MTSRIAQLCFNKSPKLPIILQNERMECGHACVVMISNFWGHQIDLFDLQNLRHSSAHGVTLLEIHQLFEKLGFVTRALQVPIDELRWVKCPAIIHWNMNHFVVLKKVKKNRIIIHDPAVGLRQCAMEEVYKSFTGVVLEVERASDFIAIRQENKLTLYHLIKDIRGVNKFLFLLLTLSFVIEIFSLLNPLFIQYVTDDVIGLSEKSNLFLIASGFLILVLLQFFADYIRGNMLVFFTNTMTEQFSTMVFKHLLKLPLAFFEKRHKGDLQTKFQSIDHIQKKMTTDFVNTVLDGIMIFINLILMAIYSRMLTLLVIAALGVYLVFRMLLYYQLKKQTALSIYSHAKSATVFLETLQSMLPIKCFLKERERLNTWRNSYVDSLNADITVSRINVLYQIGNQLLFHIEHILVVGMGALLVLAHQFSLGMLMGFLAYRLVFVNKASRFIQSIFDYKLISIQLQRLSDILFQKPESGMSVISLHRALTGSLRLENVCFSYHENENDIVPKISINIKKGEKVVLVGPSGCGKTTLLKVMMGLLEKTSGEIYIDNMSIQDFGLRNFRQQTAAVMQEDTLLSGSIIDNIAFFDEEIDMERVYDVAILVCLHDAILKLPMGYETPVGDMGSSLSGGQKQRLLLARALYKQPKILFLDEATSHLDIATERKINDALKMLNMTQVIIAHRQETIQMADRVIDMTKSGLTQNADLFVKK